MFDTTCTCPYLSGSLNLNKMLGIHYNICNLQTIACSYCLQIYPKGGIKTITTCMLTIIKTSNLTFKNLFNWVFFPFFHQPNIELNLFLRSANPKGYKTTG